jgi:hypothetical protein
MTKPKAIIKGLVRKTVGGNHAWFEAYLPKEKITVLIRKPL